MQLKSTQAQAADDPKCQNKEGDDKIVEFNVLLLMGHAALTIQRFWFPSVSSDRLGQCLPAECSSQLQSPVTFLALSSSFLLVLAVDEIIIL